MVADYSEYVDIADELLGEWGSSGATWVQPGTPGAFDPTTGYYASGTTDTNVSVTAVFSAVNQRLIDGQNVKVGDVTITMSPKGLSVLPGIGDKILRGSETYRVLNIMNAKPADTTVVCIYHARAD